MQLTCWILTRRNRLFIACCESPDDAGPSVAVRLSRAHGFSRQSCDGTTALLGITLSLKRQTRHCFMARSFMGQAVGCKRASSVSIWRGMGVQVPERAPGRDSPYGRVQGESLLLACVSPTWRRTMLSLRRRASDVARRRGTALLSARPAHSSIRLANDRQNYLSRKGTAIFAHLKHAYSS